MIPEVDLIFVSIWGALTPLVLPYQDWNPSSWHLSNSYATPWRPSILNHGHTINIKQQNFWGNKLLQFIAFNHNVEKTLAVLLYNLHCMVLPNKNKAVIVYWKALQFYRKSIKTAKVSALSFTVCHTQKQDTSLMGGLSVSTGGIEILVYIYECILTSPSASCTHTCIEYLIHSTKCSPSFQEFD